MRVEHGACMGVVPHKSDRLCGRGYAQRVERVAAAGIASRHTGDLGMFP